MVNLDLNILSQIILNGIFDQELDKEIRMKILGIAPEKQYDLACEVFHKARQIYFDLGFIDNSYTEKKDIQAREDVIESIHYKYHDIASKLFDLTCEAYFGLGFEIRQALRRY